MRRVKKYTIFYGLLLSLVCINFVALWILSYNWKCASDADRRPAYYRRCDNCNPHNFNTLVNNENICADDEDDPDDDVFLVVHVFTRAASRAERDAIRATWASPEARLDKDARRVRFAFLFGKAPSPEEDQGLREEAALFGDVLQEDFDDYYHNLARKSMMSLRWATRFCPRAKFVVRVDDDVIFHPGNLVRHLEANPEIKVGGKIQKLSGRMVQRDPNSKWFVPRADIPCPYFPEFLPGVMYVVSMDSAWRIFEASRNIPVLPVDDVYTTGIVAREHLGIPLTHIPHVFGWRIAFDACSFKRKLIAGQHPVDAKELIRLWDQMRKSDC